MSDLISVIVPFYNSEAFLPKCFDAILAQTYQDIELLIIDDGSTDGSPEICDLYATRDSRVRVIHQKNKGVASARNVGIEQAKGALICWIDGDDYVPPWYLERLYRNLCDFDADISICDHTDGYDRAFCFPPEQEARPEIMTSYQALDAIYRNDHFAFIMVAPWGKLLKKELYDGERYPDGRIFEDVYLTHQLLAKAHCIVRSDDIMYYYYKHPASILGQKLSRAKLDYLDAFRNRIAFFRERGYDELAEKARLQYLHALMWEYSRAKDLLHDKALTMRIVAEYRAFYQNGDSNPAYSHETSTYMHQFYFSPALLNLKGKIKGKLQKG